MEKNVFGSRYGTIEDFPLREISLGFKTIFIFIKD